VAMNEKINDIKFNGRNAVAVRIVNSQYRKLIDMMSDNEIHKLEPQINPNLWPELPNRYISYHRERKLLNSVIASTGNTREEASYNIYNFLKNINMYSYTFRKDIGYLE
jgi:signal transduction histidine kinase